MPHRKTPFISGEYYHIVNRSVGRMPIFSGERETTLFLEAAQFYHQLHPPTRFSIYRTSRDRFPINLDRRLVAIISYCLMPNHFHLLLRQEEEEGIKLFIQKLSNSFAHYYAVKHKSRGHVFQGNFHAVHIESDEQLVHVSRYIHLNPVTAYLVERPEDYPFSSYRIFLGKEVVSFVDSSPVLSHFSSREAYRRFVMDQKDYQRKLAGIKHLILE